MLSVCAFYNGNIYKVSAHLSQVLCVGNSIFLYAATLYTKIECVGDGGKTYTIRGQNLGNISQFWGFRPSGST